VELGVLGSGSRPEPQRRGSRGQATASASAETAGPAGEDRERAEGNEEAERSVGKSNPAFYATRPGGWRDWWNVLHVPYTAWHLSYVVIGASLAPRVDLTRLIATLLAFFFAVGIAAHALDELRGRPLRTQIPSPVLVAVSTAALAGAVAFGIAGLSRVGWPLIPFLVVGPVLVVAYNLELFGGMVHTDAGFAAAWGAFPVLTAYVAQTGRLSLGAVLAAGGAFALSSAQRHLSTPARLVRRRATLVEGYMTLSDDQVVRIDERTLLAPLELALRALSWGVILVAASLAVTRLG
jgi:hypothetical protein